jgi:tetratricopeptide (TPR) repeat protein
MAKCFINKRTLHWMAFPGGRFYPFQLRAAKSEVLHIVGKWADLKEILQKDLEAAKGFGQAYHQGHCLLKLGVLDAQRGSFPEARSKAEQALELLSSTPDRDMIFYCRATLLRIDINLKEFEKAEVTARELFELACREDNSRNQSDILNNLGLICLKTGRWQEALGYLNRKLEMAKELGDERGRASVMGNIGGVYSANQQYEKAAACDRESIAISRCIGDIYTEYFSVYNLAKTCENMGRNEEALSHYRRDLEMARQLGDGPGELVILEDLERMNAEKTTEGQRIQGQHENNKT